MRAHRLGGRLLCATRSMAAASNVAKSTPDTASVLDTSATAFEAAPKARGGHRALRPSIRVGSMSAQRTSEPPCVGRRVGAWVRGRVSAQ